jgi:hypothetical protein
MPARKWDDATKATALELYAAEGGKVASERTGVPEGTIRNWVSRTTDAIEHAAGVEIVTTSAVTMPWSERREHVVKELGGLVQLAMERTRIAFESGKMRDARDGAVALAVLIDKAQLLSGGSTSRSEAFSVNMSPDDVKARIAALEAELGAPEIEP